MFRGSRTPPRQGSCTKCADCPCVSARPAVAVNSDVAAIVHMQSHRTRPGPRDQGTGLGDLDSCNRNCCGRPRAGGLLLSSRMKRAGGAATSITYQRNSPDENARACLVQELLSRCLGFCCWSGAWAWWFGGEALWSFGSGFEMCKMRRRGSGDISRKGVVDEWSSEHDWLVNAKTRNERARSLWPLTFYLRRQEKGGKANAKIGAFGHITTRLLRDQVRTTDGGLCCQ